MVSFSDHDHELEQLRVRAATDTEERLRRLRPAIATDAADWESERQTKDSESRSSAQPQLSNTPQFSNKATAGLTLGDLTDNKPKQKNGIVLTLLADVTPQPIRWLWPGRIPLGKITILDGDPGLGKSLISLDLTARVTTKRCMPDGIEGLDQSVGVVLLSVEDDFADTIRPCLDVAGADPLRVVALSIRENNSERTPTLLDLGAIRQAITRVEARLVVIDPLMAYLPSTVNAFRDQDVRRSLAPLAALAAKTGVAVVVIRHLNKASGGNVLYRGGGSVGIIGAARSGLLVAKDPDDEGRQILAVMKSNLAKIPPALAYRVTVNAEEIPSLSWEGPTPHTATSLLAAPMEGEDRATIEEAKEFLRDLLRGGAVPAKSVQKQADQAGISYATLRRAKAVLKVIHQKKGGFFSTNKESQQWCWMLPSKDAQNPTEDAHSHEDEHLQQSNEKNTRKFNGVTEGAHPRNFEHLQASPRVYEEEL